jgi:hypothetical protein
MGRIQIPAVRLVLLMIVGGCAPAFQNSPSLAPSIVGTWYAIDSPPGAFACQGENSVSYLSDGRIVATSGPQVLHGKYTAKRTSENHFEVSVVYSADNGAQNCQGLSPEFVRAHTPESYVVERVGSDLRTCSKTVPNACFNLKKRS